MGEDIRCISPIIKKDTRRFHYCAVHIQLLQVPEHRLTAIKTTPKKNGIYDHLVVV